MYYCITLRNCLRVVPFRIISHYTKKNFLSHCFFLYKYQMIYINLLKFAVNIFFMLLLFIYYILYSYIYYFLYYYLLRQSYNILGDSIFKNIELT